MRCAIARALGPDDGGDVGRAAFLGVGAGAHRQLRERAGRQEVLERRVVVRLLVADRADDAGLVVRQLRDGDAGRPRSGELRPSAATTSRQSMRGPPAICTVAPSSRRSTSAAAGANTRSAGKRVHVRVQRHAQAARLHHVAERRRRRRPRDGRNAGTAARRGGRGGRR